MGCRIFAVESLLCCAVRCRVRACCATTGCHSLTSTHALLAPAPARRSHLPFIQKMHAIIDAGHRIAFPPLRNAALGDVIQRCLDRNPRTRITMQVRCAARDAWACVVGFGAGWLESEGVGLLRCGFVQVLPLPLIPLFSCSLSSPQELLEHPFLRPTGAAPAAWHGMLMAQRSRKLPTVGLRNCIMLALV